MARKRKVMEKFRLDEISAVDRPAQSPALATIIKRAAEDMDPEMPETEDEEDEMEMKGKKPKAKKNGDEACPSVGYGPGVVLMTSENEGHQHNIHLTAGVKGDTTTYNSGEADEGGHSHPWVITSAGQLVIGMTNGHDHTVDMAEARNAVFSATMKSESQAAHVGSEPSEEPAASAAMEETSMDQEQLEALKAQVAELTKAKDRAEAIAALPSEQRAHFDALGAEDQDAFLGKSAEDRDAVVKAAGEENPVIYKSLDGLELRKSDDPRVVLAVKRADEAVKAAEAERAKNEQMELEKRAEEVTANLPGDLTVRAALLKSVEAIADETVREGVLACLKAANQGIFERAAGKPEAHGMTKGAGFKPTSTSAEDQLDALAEKLAKETGVPLFKAYDQVLRTDEGAKLYVKFTEERAASATN